MKAWPQNPVVDLDQMASTRLLPEAWGAMRPWLDPEAGGQWNPHSAHRAARRARAALEAGREAVAARAKLPAAGLVFTSGATEANNWALKGGLLGAEPRRRRLITWETEHACVREAAHWLMARGWPVTWLGVEPDGLPSLDALDAALAEDVALVSAMRANNEIGSLWPIAELAERTHRVGALFHTDAAQAVGKGADEGLEVADLVSLSAHKMHGPKGVGALWVRAGLVLEPLLHGGGQERGRSGTQAPALVAGWGAAAAVMPPAGAAEAMRQVQRDAVQRFASLGARLNGPAPGPTRLPVNLSFTLDTADAERVMARLPGMALSTGAACSSGSGRPSAVLGAIGLEPAAMRRTLRLGWSLHDEAEAVAGALEQVAAAVAAEEAAP